MSRQCSIDICRVLSHDRVVKFRDIPSVVCLEFCRDNGEIFHNIMNFLP